jgi:hypothetical protein
MNIELEAPAYPNVAYGPWTLALRLAEIRKGESGWRVQVESPNYKYGSVTVMTYKNYDDAVKSFNHTAAGINPEVTAETERKLLCSYCKKELGEGAAFPEVLPHREYDIAYCGCRGWD